MLFQGAGHFAHKVRVKLEGLCHRRDVPAGVGHPILPQDIRESLLQSRLLLMDGQRQAGDERLAIIHRLVQPGQQLRQKGLAAIARKGRPVGIGQLVLAPDVPRRFGDDDIARHQFGVHVRPFSDLVVAVGEQPLSVRGEQRPQVGQIVKAIAILVLREHLRRVRGITAEVKELQRLAVDQPAIILKAHLAMIKIPIRHVAARVLVNPDIGEAARHQVYPSLIHEKTTVMVNHAIAGQLLGPPIQELRHLRAAR